MQRTLVIIKPDAVASGWTDQILTRYNELGVKVLFRVQRRLTEKEAGEFYAEHKNKFYFVGLKLAMSSGDSVILILEGENIIERVRKLNGATNPDKAEPGTIRRDFYSAGGPFNTVHASANEADFERERTFFMLMASRSEGARAMLPEG